MLDLILSHAEIKNLVIKLLAVFYNKLPKLISTGMFNTLFNPNRKLINSFNSSFVQLQVTHKKKLMEISRCLNAIPL